MNAIEIKQMSLIDRIKLYESQLDDLSYTGVNCIGCQYTPNEFCRETCTGIPENRSKEKHRIQKELNKLKRINDYEI